MTEAKLSAGLTCAQGMLYIMQVLQSLGLKVKLLLWLELDKKGTVDLAIKLKIGMYVDKMAH